MLNITEFSILEVWLMAKQTCISNLKKDSSEAEDHISSSATEYKPEFYEYTGKYNDITISAEKKKSNKNKKKSQQQPMWNSSEMLWW